MSTSDPPSMGTSDPLWVKVIGVYRSVSGVHQCLICPSVSLLQQKLEEGWVSIRLKDKVP